MHNAGEVVAANVYVRSAFFSCFFAFGFSDRYFSFLLSCQYISRRAPSQQYAPALQWTTTAMLIAWPVPMLAVLAFDWIFVRVGDARRVAQVLHFCPSNRGFSSCRNLRC